jgi:hypothetical protein
MFYPEYWVRILTFFHSRTRIRVEHFSPQNLHKRAEKYSKLHFFLLLMVSRISLYSQKRTHPGSGKNSSRIRIQGEKHRIQGEKHRIQGEKHRIQGEKHRIPDL